ncbi:MAG: HDIG domain-containing protein [Kiritimatiellae bacterium]|nr:HDIG domain-containing protein [Kiritimatiellia bacterium]
MTALISKSRNKRGKRLFQSHTQAQRQPAHGLTPLGLVLGLLLWLSVLFLLHGTGKLHHTRLTLDQRAPATIIATIDFMCENVAKTELTRRQAADSVWPVFSINMAPYHTAIRSLDALFDELLEQRKEPETIAETPLQLTSLTALKKQGMTLSAEEIINLLPYGKEEKMRKAIKTSLKKAWLKGLLSRSEKEALFQGIALNGNLAIQLQDTKKLRPVSINDLLRPQETLEEIVRETAQKIPTLRSRMIKLKQLLEPWLVSNLSYESDLTKATREDAQQKVKSITMKIRSGTTLAEIGERITPQILEKLKSHEKKLNQRLSRFDRILDIAGNAILLMVMMIMCGGLLQIIQPTFLRRTSHLFLLAILSLLTLLWTKGLLFLSDTTPFIAPDLLEFMAPLALAPMLTTILLGSHAAVVVGLWTSLATSLLLDNNYLLLSMGIVVTIVAAHVMRDVHRRLRIFQAGLWVGLANVLLAITVALWSQHTFPVLFAQAGVGLLSGLTTAFIALLLLPIFEVSFGITTDIRLLELSDMGHPLLQRLAMEAPGTYHHSLMVANISQTAVSEVGGNALLVRVCAYYHDIGKLTKPEFFTENSQYQSNPHDELAPSMSTLIIISHVKEGVSLALQYKLPRVVIDGIQEHHGTGVVSYFYHRARKQLELTTGTKANERFLDDRDFRYPGPKPHTLEMGVLLLADSIEAASRSLEKPTPGKIETLVTDIIDDRLRDGQLDLCGLTFAQLATLKKSFIFTLTTMLHGRVPYSHENRNNEPTEKAPDPSLSYQADHPVVDESSAGAR